MTHGRGHPVDVLVRDLDPVERWLSEAIAGRFEILDQHRCLVRGPNYILAGELALGESLARKPPRAEFSRALATAASRYWQGRGRVSLMFAENYARTDEHVWCLGTLVSAILCAAHSPG